MTASIKQIEQKATQHFTLIVLGCIFFITSSIAWYKHYEVTEYERNGHTFKSSFAPRVYQESEYFRWLYAVGPAIMDHPLYHLLMAKWAAGIAIRGAIGFKAFINRIFTPSYRPRARQRKLTKQPPHLSSKTGKSWPRKID